jgi:DNA-binding response OmpR family regulator
MPLGGTVLLVSADDGREMYGDYFRAHGLIVVDVDTPEAAFARLDTITPDVIVTDVVFPESAFRGRQCIEGLRARVEDATSIIAVSGLARKDDRDQARAAGADLYLVKPALPGDVLFEVRRALILRRSGRRLTWNWPHAVPAAVPVDRDRRQTRAS